MTAWLPSLVRIGLGLLFAGYNFRCDYTQPSGWCPLSCPDTFHCAGLQCQTAGAGLGTCIYSENDYCPTNCKGFCAGTIDRCDCFVAGCP